jgi:Putative prokaryotic signal transducing protein
VIEVYRAAGEVEAQIIKGLLESNGIPCLFKYHTLPSVFDSIGEVRVMVNDSMAEEAKRLITRKDDVQMVGESD